MTEISGDSVALDEWEARWYRIGFNTRVVDERHGNAELVPFLGVWRATEALRVFANRPEHSEGEYLDALVAFNSGYADGEYEGKRQVREKQIEDERARIAAIKAKWDTLTVARDRLIYDSRSTAIAYGDVFSFSIITFPMKAMPYMVHAPLNFSADLIPPVVPAPIDVFYFYIFPLNGGGLPDRVKASGDYPTPVAARDAAVQRLIFERIIPDQQYGF